MPATSDTTSDRKKATSFKDAQIIYLTGGWAAFALAINKGDLSRICIRKTHAALKAVNRSCVQLDTYVETKLGGGGRGRRQPTTGSIRPYRAQAQDGVTFLRLPLAPLGLAKGEIADVAFEADRIVIQRRAA